MSQATAAFPEIFTGVARPPIEAYEKAVRVVTPGKWVYKGYVHEDGDPPEFDIPVDPHSCGEHSKHLDGGYIVSWNMGIQEIVEERMTTSAEGGVPIPGARIAWLEQVPGLSTVVRDVTGQQVTIPTFTLRFSRPEDAEFIRRARDMTNDLLRYTRALELYATAKTNEAKHNDDRIAELEAENAKLRGLLNGDDD